MAKKKRYDYVRDHFKKLGWINNKVEQWDGGHMNDAFGLADMLVVAPERLILIQVCGAGDWQEHIRKISPLRTLPPITIATTLYQIGVDKRKINGRERWVYRIGYYSTDGLMIDLSSFKDKHTDLQILIDCEKRKGFLHDKQ